VTDATAIETFRASRINAKAAASVRSCRSTAWVCETRQT